MDKRIWEDCPKCKKKAILIYDGDDSDSVFGVSTFTSTKYVCMNCGYELEISSGCDKCGLYYKGDECDYCNGTRINDKNKALQQLKEAKFETL